MRTQKMKMITTDRMMMPWKMSLPMSFLITETKGLFIRAETPHLPDLALTSEVNFKHCHSLEYDKHNDLLNEDEQLQTLLNVFY